MTPENFCYWLWGMFEINESQGFDKHEFSIETVDLIKAHLKLVFNRVTESEYKLIDTRFDGVKSLPLCGEGIKWEEEYYKEPTSTCKDANPLPEFPTGIRIGVIGGSGQVGKEQRYC